MRRREKITEKPMFQQVNEEMETLRKIKQQYFIKKEEQGISGIKNKKKHKSMTNF